MATMEPTNVALPAAEMAFSLEPRSTSSLRGSRSGSSGSCGWSRGTSTRPRTSTFSLELVDLLVRHAEELGDVCDPPQRDGVAAQENVLDPREPVPMPDQVGSGLRVLPPPVASDHAGLEEAEEATKAELARRPVGVGEGTCLDVDPP
jgi:hypothetical protein